MVSQSVAIETVKQTFKGSGSITNARRINGYQDLGSPEIRSHCIMVYGPNKTCLLLGFPSVADLHLIREEGSG